MGDGGSKRRSAPAFNTGGGGFHYEDLVGSWLVAAMLAGAEPLGPAIGIAAEIQFQRNAPGSHLDDIVVVGEGLSGPRWSASVKSFDMLTGSKIEAAFVEVAWTELLEGSFEAGRDRIGLVCGRAAEGNWQELLDLTRTCAADPEGMAGRIGVEGAFNGTARSLWGSCKCPEKLARNHSCEDISPARLLAALLPLRLDLLEETSRARREAVQWCREALVAGQAENASDLWQAIETKVATVRPLGGVVGDTPAQAWLAPRFKLRNRSDLRQEWELIDRHVTEALATVRDTLGEGLRLPRAEAWAELHAASEVAAVTLLIGPSGCGKSALAKRWVQDGDASAIWLSSSDLDAGLSNLAHRLQLQQGLSRILELSATPIRIVIDGLDRSYEAVHFEATALLAGLAEASNGKVKMVVTAQQMESQRVGARLRDANAPVWRLALIGDLDEADLQIVQEAEPRMHELAVKGSLHSLFRRPKLVDVVLRAGEAAEGGLIEVGDEAALARLWWNHFVRDAPNSASRQALVLKLATDQADRMVPATMTDELAPADVAWVDELRRDGVLSSEASRYEFAHDLFADWALLRRLDSLGERSVEELGAKVELPTWHRAIRLYAIGLMADQGLEIWSERRTRLEDEDRLLVAELFLDAALFSADSAAVVRSLWPTLVADGGGLLRRLLRRLRYSASIPDPRGGMIFPDAPELETHWATQSRVPLWPIWVPLLEVLDEHRAEAINLAGGEVAALVAIWLLFAGPRSRGSTEAAQIGLECGRFVRAEAEAGSVFEDKLEEELWKAALAAGALEPEAVLEMFSSALSPADRDESKEDK
jgi:hypothetical protein